MAETSSNRIRAGFPAAGQHFSFCYRQSLDFNSIFTNFKTVSNSEFLSDLSSAKIRGEERMK